MSSTMYLQDDVYWLELTIGLHENNFHSIDKQSCYPMGFYHLHVGMDLNHHG